MNAQTEDLKVGDTAPSFCLPDKDDRETCLTDFKSKWTVLYFYPKGKVAHVWRKVKVKGHVEAVKSRVLELQEKG